MFDRPSALKKVQLLKSWRRLIFIKFIKYKVVEAAMMAKDIDSKEYTKKRLLMRSSKTLLMRFSILCSTDY